MLGKVREREREREKERGRERGRKRGRKKNRNKIEISMTFQGKKWNEGSLSWKKFD